MQATRIVTGHDAEGRADFALHAPLTHGAFEHHPGFVANLLAIPWITLVVTPLALAGVVLAPLWDVAAWTLRPLAAEIGRAHV